MIALAWGMPEIERPGDAPGNVAAAVIDRFGGATSLSQALGHRHAGTVQSWKDRGCIPTRQQALVLAAAKRAGVPLTAADFFPNPEENAIAVAIAAFGGLVKAARAGNWPVSTVQSWLEKGRVPKWRQHEIVAAANRAGVALPNEFLKARAA